MPCVGELWHSTGCPLLPELLSFSLFCALFCAAPPALQKPVRGGGSGCVSAAASGRSPSCPGGSAELGNRSAGNPGLAAGSCSDRGAAQGRLLPGRGDLPPRHQKPSAVEMSEMSERSKQNVANGLAWSFYVGYLKIVLPRVKKSMEEFSRANPNLPACRKTWKLHILVPLSCDVYDDLEKADSNIQYVTELTETTLARAGIKKRVYKHSLYAITDEENQSQKKQRPTFCPERSCGTCGRSITRRLLCSRGATRPAHPQPWTRQSSTCRSVCQTCHSPCALMASDTAPHCPWGFGSPFPSPFLLEQVLSMAATPSSHPNLLCTTVTGAADSAHSPVTSFPFSLLCTALMFFCGCIVFFICFNLCHIKHFPLWDQLHYPKFWTQCAVCLMW
uniref:Stimulator of interferon response cGAMP interactor 1 n=1 Tax=Serinus canaria TaxID=9135 RepID=A0A8C9N5G6_SERCA